MVGPAATHGRNITPALEAHLRKLGEVLGMTQKEVQEYIDYYLEGESTPPYLKEKIAKGYKSKRYKQWCKDQDKRLQTDKETDKINQTKKEVRRKRRAERKALLKEQMKDSEPKNQIESEDNMAKNKNRKKEEAKAAKKSTKVTKFSNKAELKALKEKVLEQGVTADQFKHLYLLSKEKDDSVKYLKKRLRRLLRKIKAKEGKGKKETTKKRQKRNAEKQKKETKKNKKKNRRSLRRTGTEGKTEKGKESKGSMTNSKKTTNRNGGPKGSSSFSSLTKAKVNKNMTIEERNRTNEALLNSLYQKLYTYSRVHLRYVNEEIIHEFITLKVLARKNPKVFAELLNSEDYLFISFKKYIFKYLKQEGERTRRYNPTEDFDIIPTEFITTSNINESIRLSNLIDNIEGMDTTERINAGLELMGTTWFKTIKDTAKACKINKRTLKRHFIKSIGR